ncbi:MAG: lamin tail domain-containing protein, partial [Verrucomicrobiota bacterium]
HIAAATFINPGAFVVLTADEKPGPDHLSFKLPASGGAITLLAPNGEELDATIYGPQAPGISSGRLPDGTGSWQPLPYSPTPGGSNYIAELGSRLRIGEFLARAQPGPDWVEVENVSDAPIALGGFQFEIEVAAVRQTHPFHADRRLNAGERMLIYLGPVPPTFTPLPNSETFDTPLADEGALLMLRDALGRIIDRVEYGAQITNRSAGRFGQNWVLLGAPSPGQPNGGAAAVDSGSQLRLNEWLAGGGGTNDFVEIYNPAVLPVNLTGWNLTDDPSIVGATNRQLSSLTFIDGGGFLRFHTDGQHAPGHLPFGLDVLGETIRLLNPNGVVIDSVNYRVQLEAVSEGRYPDGAALIVAFPGSATPGAANIVPAMDQDKDGMDDTWERAYGLNPADPADAFADLDGDGQSNLTEFRSGTDPSNPSSLFQISVAVTAASGQATIRFLAAPGRTYTVQYADQLTPAHWASLAQVPANSAWREVLTTDPAAVPERSSRFYRVLTQP